jgi:hypothetical protein
MDKNYVEGFAITIPVSYETFNSCCRSIMASRTTGISDSISSVPEKNIRQELEGILSLYGDMPLMTLIQNCQVVTNRAGFYLN